MGSSGSRIPVPEELPSPLETEEAPCCPAEPQETQAQSSQKMMASLSPRPTSSGTPMPPKGWPQTHVLHRRLSPEMVRLLDASCLPATFPCMAPRVQASAPTPIMACALLLAPLPLATSLTPKALHLETVPYVFQCLFYSSPASRTQPASPGSSPAQLG